VIRFDYEQNISMEVRLHNVSFFVPYDDNKKSDRNSIHTVWNQTLLYHVLQFLQRLRAVTRREVPRLFPQPAYRPILSDVSLCLKPGKMYLILGAPCSGKTTLLKAIAGLLPNNRVLAGKNKGQPRPQLPYIEGSVEYNGHKMEVIFLFFPFHCLLHLLVVSNSFFFFNRTFGVFFTLMYSNPPSLKTTLPNLTSSSLEP
jgi:hypothetical protein